MYNLENQTKFQAKNMYIKLFTVSGQFSSVFKDNDYIRIGFYEKETKSLVKDVSSANK